MHLLEYFSVFFFLSPSMLLVLILSFFIYKKKLDELDFGIHRRKFQNLESACREVFIYYTPIRSLYRYIGSKIQIYNSSIVFKLNP